MKNEQKKELLKAVNDSLFHIDEAEKRLNAITPHTSDQYQIADAKMGAQTQLIHVAHHNRLIRIIINSIICED
jgi:hypothetical protein